MAHKNFKVCPEDELRNRTFHRDIASLTLFQDLFLKNFVKADPSKSTYGFTLNCRKLGHFNLCFLANKSSAVQTWISFAASIPSNRILNVPQPQPARVAPEAYYLFDAPAPDVSERSRTVRNILYWEVQEGHTVPLPYDVWYPRILLWCKVVDLVIRIKFYS